MSLLTSGAVKKIVLVRPAVMRGRILSSACMILDEGQNATVAQMKMFRKRPVVLSITHNYRRSTRNRGGCRRVG